MICLKSVHRIDKTYWYIKTRSEPLHLSEKLQKYMYKLKEAILVGGLFPWPPPGSVRVCPR